MKKVIHRAGTRGHSDHGWLDSYHTFSFADYHDPERIHFGALRVLNDDTVAGGEGFGAHPHDNMEIVSIPLEGELRHQDSMGHTSVLRTGEIQVMTAGTGIIHSEFNNSPDRPVKFLRYGYSRIDADFRPVTRRSRSLRHAPMSCARSWLPKAMVPSIRLGFISRPGSTP